jgi:hypothetical protein
MPIKRFKSFVAEAASGGRPNDNTEKDLLEPKPKGEKDFKAKHKMTVTKHPVAGDHQFDGDRAEITEEKYLNQKGTGESDDGYADAGLFDKSKADKLAKKHKGKAVKDSGGKFLVQLGEEAAEVSDLDEQSYADQVKEKKKQIRAWEKQRAASLKKMYADLEKKDDNSIKAIEDRIKEKKKEIAQWNKTNNALLKNEEDALAKAKKAKKNIKESVELAEGKVVDQLNDIVKTKSAKKVKFGNGKSETIDMTTASALVNMLNKLNPANSAKAEKMLEKSPEGMFQLVDIAFGGKS